MAKISRIDELKDRFAGAADKIVAGWLQARDERKFYENWKKAFEKLGAKVGPTTEKRYVEGVKGVTKDRFESRVKESSEKYYKKFLEGIAR